MPYSQGAAPLEAAIISYQEGQLSVSACVCGGHFWSIFEAIMMAKPLKNRLHWPSRLVAGPKLKTWKKCKVIGENRFHRLSSKTQNLARSVLEKKLVSPTTLPNLEYLSMLSLCQWSYQPDVIEWIWKISSITFKRSTYCTLKFLFFLI